MNKRLDKDSTGIERAVEDIEGASFLFAVVLIFAPCGHSWFRSPDGGF